MNIRAALVLALGVSLFPPAAAAATQEPVPTSFKIGPQGDLICVGMTEDACAFYDELPTPSGVRYLVQGSYTRKPDAATLHLGGADYITSYFALLCDREGDMLTSVFSFLEGREKASDVHIHDLDADGTPEIIVTGIFDSRGSYAAVYRITGAEPERIFSRRANTPNTDFELDHGQASLTFEQRDKVVSGQGASGEARQEIFTWNGQTFVPVS